MGLDLTLSETEKMIKKMTSDFMRREISKGVLQELINSDIGYTNELWKKAVDMGWLALIIPDKYGGMAHSFTNAGVLFEVLGRGPLPGPYFSSGILCSLVLLESGTEEQKQSILPSIASGEYILSLALTEPDYSWEPSGIETTAIEKNGSFILKGVKLFVIDGQASTHFIVATRLGTDKGSNIALFLVDRKTKGVNIRRLSGFFNQRSFELTLDSIMVPKSSLLGNADNGWQALTQGINKSIPVLSAYKVGGCQAVLDMTVEYSRTRTQFGQAIGRFQRVQDMILEILDYVEAARWTTYEALWKLDTQRPFAESIHLAKAVSSESYWQSCTLAHRIFGGVSFAKDHPLSFHTMASRYLYNFLGDPSYHRKELAKLITGQQ